MKTGGTGGSGEKRTAEAGVTNDSSTKNVTNPRVAADSDKNSDVIPVTAGKSLNRLTSLAAGSKVTFKSALKNLGDLYQVSFSFDCFVGKYT
jgi:hypothetical protein